MKREPMKREPMKRELLTSLATHPQCKFSSRLVSHKKSGCNQATLSLPHYVSLQQPPCPNISNFARFLANLTCASIRFLQNVISCQVTSGLGNFFDDVEQDEELLQLYLKNLMSGAVTYVYYLYVNYICKYKTLIDISLTQLNALLVLT